MNLLRVILNCQSFPNLSTLIHNKVLKSHLAVGLFVPCQQLHKDRTLPLPGTGDPPLPTAPRPSSDSCDHNESLARFLPSVPDLPLGCREHVCLALHTTAQQTPEDHTLPPPSLLRDKHPKSVGHTQSPWLPALSPSKEWLRSPHSSVTRSHMQSPRVVCPATPSSGPSALIIAALCHFCSAGNHITYCLGSANPVLSDPCPSPRNLAEADKAKSKALSVSF